MHIKLPFVLAALFIAFNIAPDIAAAQSAQTKTEAHSSRKAPIGETKTGDIKAKKPAGHNQAPKTDIDSFFEDAEAQTRKAQEHGGSGCVPKPEPKESKPVS
jgi:hypothetical protein